MDHFKKIEEDININLEPRLTNNEQTPFVHLYRAEIQRLVVYKQRLDTSVNWCLIMSTYLWSIYLSNLSDLNIYYMSLVIFFSQLLIMIFDVNRYANYYDIKYRCQLMEYGMYYSFFDEENCLKDWKAKLMHTWSLDKKEYLKIRPNKIKFFFIRLRNIYAYIYLLNISIFFLLLKVN